MAAPPPSTPQPLNPTSMRFPFDLTGKVEPEVAQAHEFHFNAAVDLNNAIGLLKGQISALQQAKATSTATTTTTVPAQSTPPSSNLPSSGLGAVNYQTASTYLLAGSDYAGLVGLDGTTTLQLNSGVNVPFFSFIYNMGGSAATLIPTSGTVNGQASVGLGNGQISLVFFDGTNWVSMSPLLAQTLAKVTSKWLDSYDATTGLFTQSQPTAADVLNAFNLAAPTTTYNGALTLGSNLSFSAEAIGLVFPNTSTVSENGTVGLEAFGNPSILLYTGSGQFLGITPGDGTNTANVLQLAGITSPVTRTVFELIGANSVSYLINTQATLLDPSNTYEFQIGCGALSSGLPPTFAATFAVGNTSIVANAPAIFKSTVTLAADPTTPLEAATKQYVDAVTASGASGTVNLAPLTGGGTPGSLTVVNGIITAITNPT